MALHHQESKDPGHNKPSASLLIKLTVCASIAASVFAHSPAWSQTSKSMIEKKDTIKSIQEKDGIFYMDTIEYNKKVSELITEINIYRKSKNLDTLQPHPILNKTAQEYADYCIKNYWPYGHIDKEGKTPIDRCEKNGYTGGVLENIFYGIPKGGNDAKYVVEFRKTRSSRHNLAMIDKSSKYIGVGITKFNNGDNNNWYIYVIDIGKIK